MSNSEIQQVLEVATLRRQSYEETMNTAYANSHDKFGMSENEFTANKNLYGNALYVGVITKYVDDNPKANQFLKDQYIKVRYSDELYKSVLAAESGTAGTDILDILNSERNYFLVSSVIISCTSIQTGKTK